MMQYALFARPVVTIYDLPQTTKQSEAGLVSTIGDEGLYGQACQVRTAPGGVTAEGVPLSPEVAEVVTFYGYHGFVRRDALKFVSEDALRAYLPQPLVLVAIVVIGLYLGFKREFTKLIGFLVVAMLSVGLVFNAAGVKDVLLNLFNQILGA